MSAGLIYPQEKVIWQSFYIFHAHYKPTCQATKKQRTMCFVTSHQCRKLYLHTKLSEAKGKSGKWTLVPGLFHFVWTYIPLSFYTLYPSGLLCHFFLYQDFQSGISPLELPVFLLYCLFCFPVFISSISCHLYPGSRCHWRSISCTQLDHKKYFPHQ